MTFKRLKITFLRGYMDEVGGYEKNEEITTVTKHKTSNYEGCGD